MNEIGSVEPISESQIKSIEVTLLQGNVRPHIKTRLNVKSFFPIYVFVGKERGKLLKLFFLDKSLNVIVKPNLLNPTVAFFARN